MKVLDAVNLPTFTAADGCILAEVIHPARGGTSPGVSLARATVPAGGRTIPHRLDFVEIYYVLCGRGIMHHGGKSDPIQADSCVYLPPGEVQWVENSSGQDLVFLCICHPAYDPDGDRPAE